MTTKRLQTTINRLESGTGKAIAHAGQSWSAQRVQWVALEQQERNNNIMTQQSLFDDFDDKPQEGQQELKDWHGNPVPISPNPMVRLYGAMEGKKCKDCKHLFKELYRSASYLKCDLRKLTRGPGSDHRSKWQACKRFEEDQES